MAQMSEAVRELIDDCRDKAITARSARSRRTHCGKSGPVRLPSDNLTQAQWEAKNGPVKTYRMNDPMTWEQFNELPDDLKVCYIKAIRKKYYTPDYILAIFMGVHVDTFNQKLEGLKLKPNNNPIGWYDQQAQAEFAKWWNKIKTITRGGTLETEGNVEEDLKKLMETLKGHNVKLKVDWEIMED